MIKSKVNVQKIKSVFALNLVLFTIFSLLLSFYVVQSNMLAADKYRIKILNEELASLNESKASLSVQRLNTEDLSMLLEFARTKGMVEAKNAIYVFENGNIALQR